MQGSVFALRWWSLSKPYRGHHGITINGFSDMEMAAIRSWCDRNGIAKLTRPNGWTDGARLDPHAGLVEFNIMAADIEYREHEMAAYGPDHAVEGLCVMLASLPPRHHEILMRGLDAAELRRICEGSNHRIIQDIQDDLLFGVSTDSKQAFFELTLRNRMGAMEQ